MELVERGAEAAALEDLYRASLDGQGTVAVISGALGNGKTALLRAFHEQLNKRGVRHFRATASPSEQRLPMGLIDQLFRSRELAAPRHARLSWILAEGAMESDRSAHGADCDGEISGPTLGWLWDTLTDLTEGGPLVITIDDVHFADTASLRCLVYLIHRLQYIPAIVLISECSHVTSMRRLIHSEILGLPYSRHLRLRPLSRAGVTRVIAERMGSHAGRCLSRPYYEATGGNPRLLRGLLADGQDVSAGPAGIALGDSFERSVLAVMYRAEPTLVEVAGALALLDHPVPPESLSTLFDMDAASVGEAIAILTDTGLMESGTFRRDEARLAIINGMQPTLRMQMHRRIAALLNDAGAALPAVARHLVAGGSPVAPWGIRALRQAAQQAVREGEPITAVLQLRLAYRTCSNPRDTARVAAELAATEWRIDPSTVTMHLPALVAAHAGGYLDVQQALTLAGHLAWHGRTPQAVSVLEGLDAVCAGEDHRDGGLPAGAAVLYLRDFLPGLSGAPPGGHSHNRPAASIDALDHVITGTTADPPRIVPHLAILGLDAALRVGVDARVLSDAERTLRRIDIDDVTLLPVYCALMTLIYGDRFDTAAYWCDSYLSAAQTANAPMWRAVFAATRSAIHLCHGELPAAEKRIGEALGLIPPQSWGTAVGAPLAIMVRTATALGAYDKAASYANLPMPEATFLNLSWPHFLSARGHFLLATDQPEAALGDFLRCGELMRRWGIDQPVVAWRADAAQAYLRLDDATQARHLAEDQLARLRPGPSRARALTLRVLAAASAPEEREPLLRDAVQASTICGDQLSAAHALADLGAVLHAANRHADARAMAQDALRLAERCGCAPLVGSLRVRVGAAGAPIASASTDTTEDGTHADVLSRLSMAERRVATLAAQGCTNNQIARRLYITVSTVEQHLTRIYRKLTIRRRSELPAELQLSVGS